MDRSIIQKLIIILIFTITPVKAVDFEGKFLQGHFILGKTNPGSEIIIDKKKIKVSEDGFFAFGLDRDRKFDVKIIKINNGKKEIIKKKYLKENIEYNELMVYLKIK